MNVKFVFASLLVVLFGFILMVWLGSRTIPIQSETNSEYFDPNAAPKEAIQRVWRTGDNTVQLQYTYSAPNPCWQKGNTSSLSFEGDTALLILVPEIKDGFCAEVMSPVTFDQVIEMPNEMEVLIVQVDHQEGGLIERNELWIEPSE